MAIKLDKVADIVELLGKKGSLRILDSLLNAPLRYHELRETCSSDKTLSERLKQLEENEFIETISQKADGRFFVHYIITDRGRQVLEKVKEIT